MWLPDYSLPFELYAEGMHFASSACAGLAGYFWTQTILSRAWPGPVTPRQLFWRASSAWSVALFAALLMHFLADYVLDPWLRLHGIPGGF